MKTNIQIGDKKMSKEDYQSVYIDNGNKHLMNGNYYVNNNDKNISDVIENSMKIIK